MDPCHCRPEAADPCRYCGLCRNCIRVSGDDIYEVESNKEKIIQELGEGVSLDLVEEKGLEKGQCVIETQSQMVDCGFQTQLDTLIRDLKMLVHS